jgi:hypothetical protein
MQNVKGSFLRVCDCRCEICCLRSTSHLTNQNRTRLRLQFVLAKHAGRTRFHRRLAHLVRAAENAAKTSKRVTTPRAPHRKN